MTRRERSIPFILGALAAAFGIVAGAPAPVAADPPDLLIDSFDIDVPQVELDCPDATIPFTTSLAGPAIAGGEVDLVLDCHPPFTTTAVGVSRLAVSAGGLTADNLADPAAWVTATWDGPDGSPALDPTGLGGIDLTGAGTKDALTFEFSSGDMTGGVSAAIELLIYSDAGRVSRAAGPLTGPWPGATFSMPFARFTPFGGPGADLTDVGAIQVNLADATGSGAFTLGSLQTTTLVRASMADALAVDADSNGVPSPGDIIEYTVTIANDPDLSTAAAANTVFTVDAPAGGSLVPGSVTTAQGTVLTGNGPTDTGVEVNLGLVLNDTDPTITFRVMATTAGPLTTRGQLAYTPDTGTTTTTTETDDPDTPAFSDATVTTVIDVPVFADDDTTQTRFDTPITGNVLTNDTGPTGGLEASLVTAPVNGTVVLNVDGSFTYTPNSGFSGTDTLTYRATSPLTEASDDAVLTINVEPAVIANDEGYETAFETLVTGNVLANDAGPALQIVASLVTPPVNGSVVLDADGSFTYTPDTGFSGTDTFAYRTTSVVTSASDDATVSISVAPPVPVVANPDSFETPFGTPVSGNVLANDTGPADGLTAELVDGPTNGTLVFDADGNFTYTPDAGFSGADGFTYRAGTLGQTGPTGPTGPLTLALPGDVAAVTIAVAAAPTTTPPPTTTTAPTVPPDPTLPPVPTTPPLAPTIPPTLPATGSDGSGLAMTALVVLGLGGAITFAMRRRRTA